MKTRELVCKNYVNEGGVCEKRGIPCHFYKEMQHCKLYEARKGAVPKKKDLRREKKADAARRDMKEDW